MMQDQWEKIKEVITTTCQEETGLKKCQQKEWLSAEMAQPNPQDIAHQLWKAPQVGKKGLTQLKNGKAA